MLQLTKSQYKQLCADCAAQMMQGSGHGGQIEDFSGTDMQFRVKPTPESEPEPEPEPELQQNEP